MSSWNSEVEADETLLRVRGGSQLAERLAEPGTIRVSTREPLEPGDRVAVEVSFGALTDEVLVRGRVHEVAPPEPGVSSLGSARREVTVWVDEQDADRLTYVRAVAGGRRDASARAHRRVPADLPVVWAWERGTHRSHLVDISRGGAFISSESPPVVGQHVEVEIPSCEPRQKLRVRSIVTWISQSEERSGFGVEFRIADRSQAACLAEVVRQSEAAALAS